MSLDVSAYDALFPSGVGPDVIEQIPLGQTVFPFKDLDASGRMIRQPLYGDDIIPVSALVVGQHPTTGDAQTVDTDGHHRLKVTMASDGGGGLLSPYTQRRLSGTLIHNYNSSHISLTATNRLGLISRIDVLYGLSWSIGRFDVSQPNFYNHAVLQMYNYPAEAVGIELVSFGVVNNPVSFTPSSASESGFVSFGGGIDVAATLGAYDALSFWFVGGFSQVGYLDVVWYCS